MNTASPVPTTHGNLEPSIIAMVTSHGSGVQGSSCQPQKRGAYGMVAPLTSGPQEARVAVPYPCA